MSTIQKQGEEIQARIRDLAYALWESAGRQQGMAMEYWLQAEKEVMTTVQRMASAAMPKPAQRKAAPAKAQPAAKAPASKPAAKRTTTRAKSTAKATTKK